MKKLKEEWEGKLKEIEDILVEIESFVRERREEKLRTTLKKIENTLVGIDSFVRE